jgi:nitronate monooxygenase/enoyl-[acyl-carrier protein] reductase II
MRAAASRLRTPVCDLLGLDSPVLSAGRTRLLASEEGVVPREYRERVVAARAEDTVYTGLLDGGWPDSPHRILRTRAVAERGAAGRRPRGRCPGAGTIIGTGTPGYAGDLERFALYHGESCSLVNDIEPAGQIVLDTVSAAEAVLAPGRR